MLSSRKREIRLLKNREAARECRRKKKEYIKCLENRSTIVVHLVLLHVVVDAVVHVVVVVVADHVEMKYIKCLENRSTIDIDVVLVLLVVDAIVVVLHDLFFLFFFVSKK